MGRFGRRLTAGQRAEEQEWRDFDHKQRVKDLTERDGDTEFLRLSDGPPVADPNAGRTVRVTVPGRERVERTQAELVGVVAGVAVYEDITLSVPAGREALDFAPATEGRLRRERDAGRNMVMVLPAQWTPEDVLGFLQYAHAVLDATMHNGRPIRALSGLAQLMARHGEAPTSLVDARWVPTAGEVSLAEWVAGWTKAVTSAREKVAVAMTVRGESLRRIGAAIGLAPGDTNRVKTIVRQGLMRIACKLDRAGPQAWPRLRELNFRVDGDG